MKLLLAVDSIASAELVAATVASRPWASGTRARALTVIDYAHIPVDLVNETGGQMRLIRPEMEKRASRVTARAVELLRQSGVEAEESVGSGDPRSVIVDTAGEWGADLIYVRAHVYRDISRWMMGSVAREVLRNAPCSVGVVRAAADDGAPTPASGGMRILLATDGSESARAAARSVSERLWPEGAEVRVIGVVNPNERSIYAAAQLMVAQDEEAEGAQGAVNETVEFIGDAGLRVTGEAAVGDAKTLIVGRAKEWGAHLVVVGSHGRRGSERLFLGSVSEYVANHAHCSAEVIRRQTVEVVRR